MSSLVTFENMLIPANLSGLEGRNRARSPGCLAANDDQAAVIAWLARYADSPATFASYRKEAERLILWCTLQRGVALSDLTHEDLLLYRKFLADPQPADRWVMAQGQKPARKSPLWRPFAGPLGASSQCQALSILNAMMTWLVEAGYLAGNPLALARRKKRMPTTRVSRFLPLEHWQAVKTTIEAMAINTPREQKHAARCRWLFTLLYIGGLRASEVCQTRMGSFFKHRSNDGRERWWLEVIGKGSKKRLVPATAELITELMRYRASHQLSPLPHHADETPLLIPIIGSCKPMARTALHEIVKGVMCDTAARMRSQGPEYEAMASDLEKASAHWMRHTAGSHMSDNVDLKLVRDNLGHANISTTSIYLHTDDNARHDATNEVHRVEWAKKPTGSS